MFFRFSATLDHPRAGESDDEVVVSREMLDDHQPDLPHQRLGAARTGQDHSPRVPEGLGRHLHGEERFSPQPAVDGPSDRSADLVCLSTPPVLPGPLLGCIRLRLRPGLRFFTTI